MNVEAARIGIFVLFVVNTVFTGLGLEGVIKGWANWRLLGFMEKYYLVIGSAVTPLACLWFAATCFLLLLLQVHGFGVAKRFVVDFGTFWVIGVPAPAVAASMWLGSMMTKPTAQPL